MLQAGDVVTTAYEFGEGKFVLGLDEPRYYVLNANEMVHVEDPCVHNKICSQIVPFSGEISAKFMLVRNRSMISLLNISTMRC